MDRTGPDSGNCDSCAAPILWGLHFKTGKRMPADIEAQATTGTRFRWDDIAGRWVTCKGDEMGHVSHFATCPDGPAHRRK